MAAARSTSVLVPLPPSIETSVPQYEAESFPAPPSMTSAPPPPLIVSAPPPPVRILAADDPMIVMSCPAPSPLASTFWKLARAVESPTD
jgi:hypothetical protein